MFDLTSSKLLILGIVALIVVGPKELPFLLRTIGKYVGMIRRQANEFRAQFDEAMREAELDSIKKDIESVARDAENTIRDAQTTVERDIHAAEQDLDKSLQAETSAAAEPAPHTFDPLNGLETGTHEAAAVAAAETSSTAAESVHQMPAPHHDTQDTSPPLVKTGT